MKPWRFTLSDNGKWYFGIVFANTKEEAKETLQSNIKSNLKIECVHKVDSLKNNIYIAGGVFPGNCFGNNEINDIFIL